MAVLAVWILRARARRQRRRGGRLAGCKPRKKWLAVHVVCVGGDEVELRSLCGFSVCGATKL